MSPGQASSGGPAPHFLTPPGLLLSFSCGQGGVPLWCSRKPRSIGHLLGTHHTHCCTKARRLRGSARWVPTQWRGPSHTQVWSCPESPPGDPQATPPPVPSAQPLCREAPSHL